MGGDSLLKMPQRCGCQCLFKFRMAGKDDLQELTIGPLKICEGGKLVEGFRTQVLRFIKEEDFKTSMLIPRVQVIVQERELRPRVAIDTRDPTLFAEMRKNVLKCGSGAGEKGHMRGFIERERKFTQERRFSCPRLPREEEESPTLTKGGKELSIPFFVGGIGVKEPRVGSDAEWRRRKNKL